MAGLATALHATVATARIDRKAAWALAPRLIWLAYAPYVSVDTAVRSPDDLFDRAWEESEARERHISRTAPRAPDRLQIPSGELRAGGSEVARVVTIPCAVTRIPGVNGRRRTVIYLAISFAWTWTLWVGGWMLGQARQAPINTGGTLFDLTTVAESPAFLPQLLFSMAVYGPLLGYLAARRYRPVWGQPTPETALLVVAVPTVTVSPAIALSLATGVPAAGLTAGAAAGAIGVYFVSNLVPSGTEEFGWRGYLHPELRRHERTFWPAAWKGGLVWAIWHYPLMVILYWQLGFLMIPTIAGFTASIIAMAWITALIYEQSNSIALAALLHALNNTANFALMLLFPTSPFTIVTAAMAWVVVVILEKRYHVDREPAPT